jgi:hypothetical protein
MAITKFPPCWHGLKEYYRSLFTSSLQSEIFEKVELFNLVITLLERYLESSGHQSVGHAKAGPSTYKESTYNKWESKLDDSKCDFNLLTRDDKLQRLFLVLNVLVKILELDMAVWVLKYPQKTKFYMEEKAKKPILARLLWGDDSSGHATPMIKRIIDMFVNAVSLDYPKRDVKALAVS